VDREPQRAEAVPEVHGEVAGLLHYPCPGWARGHPRQVHPAGAMLDKYQHVQPLQQHRLHHQEVTGDDRVSLSGQELPPGRPGPPGRWIDAGGVQDLPHRGRGNRVPQPRQLALDPPVPPGRVLPRHPDDQRLDRRASGRPPWPAPAGVVLLAGDQVTAPAQDRGRGDREDLRPPAPTHQPRQRREPHSVGMIPPQPATELTAQHLVLMAQHQQLGVLGQIRPGQHSEQAEQAPHQAVHEQQQHPEMVPATSLIPQQNPSSRHETEFPSGTPCRSLAITG
jgi:hypothetical protein